MSEASNKPTIIIDAGHGKTTSGKRSPVWSDGSQLFEWEFNRDVASRICRMLVEIGVPVINITQTPADTPLSVRVRTINKLCSEGGECILISIHANAGRGSGWECYTRRSPGQHKSRSKEIAGMIEKHIHKVFPNTRMRGVKESDFYILKNTRCPAILTENFFMDNEKDCRMIMDDDVRERIARAHVDALLEVIG